MKREVEPNTISVKLVPLQLWAPTQKGAFTFEVLWFYITITLTQSDGGAPFAGWLICHLQALNFVSLESMVAVLIPVSLDLLITALSSPPTAIGNQDRPRCSLLPRISLCILTALNVARKQ